jgi:hypothetical protein
LIVALVDDGTTMTAVITGPVVEVFDTVTFTELLAVKLPRVSVATAAKKCEPLVDVDVFQDIE